MRPYDIKSPDEKIINGVLKMDKKTGNQIFYTPKNSTYKVWNNYSLENFSQFWDLPNINEAKYIYFQEVYFHKLIPNQEDLKITFSSGGCRPGKQTQRNSP